MGVYLPYSNFSTDKKLQQTLTIHQNLVNPIPLHPSQTTFTMLAVGISVHNIVQHNRDISLYNSPTVE